LPQAESREILALTRDALEQEMDETAVRVAKVEFTGGRGQLFGLLLRGHLLIVPTLGIYRFWMLTWKRRFYWQNTVVDGDALEYSGRAMQLLIGFLFALGFFLPIYIGFFYISTQGSEIAVLGYGLAALLLWFLMGYAAYRGRDFRLSRTLWRGIRFDQKGNAWGYALRRFGWSILMVLTAGLVYPAMCASLWRYRWRNTWYGDRPCSFTGNWRQLAGPYYRVYFSLLVMSALVLGLAQGDALTLEDGTRIPGVGFWFAAILEVILAVLGFFYFRARESSRMFSAIRCGSALVRVHVRARALFGQFVLYCLSLMGGGFAVLVVIGILVGAFAAATETRSSVDPQALTAIFQVGWVTLLAIVLGYLAAFAALGILGDVFLGYGYWLLVARGASIVNVDSLASVRAAAEDRALAGEGLADALNVGAY
jgi:uncharacterized membrane protein YjgN (DUF898 family)